jgi:hypothetical protein
MMRGLQGWWPLQEGAGITAFDLSHNQNVGTLTNMDQTTDWVVGQSGGVSLDFDGTDDEVAITAAVISGYPCTFSAWIRPDTSHIGGIFSVGGNPSNVRKEVGLIINGGIVWALSQNNAGSPQFDYAGTSVPTGEWSHVAAVFESNTSRKVYLNGELKATNTTSISIDGLSRTKIGQRANTMDAQEFDGAIQDCRVWNYAFTTEQVHELYLNPWAPLSTKSKTFLTASAPGIIYNQRQILIKNQKLILK